MSMPDGSPASAPQPEHPPLPLEARLDELAALVTSLEARIASLEGGQVVTSAVATAKADISEVFPAAIPVESLPSPSGLMTLIGRVCLILGGATLIRALVDAGTIRNGWGVALGLAYASPGPSSPGAPGTPWTRPSTPWPPSSSPTRCSWNPPPASAFCRRPWPPSCS